MKIFLTGATGYIGGSVALGLIKDGHEVIGLVRSKERATQVAAMNIEPIIGSLDNLDLLEKFASSSDAIINAADAEHKKSVYYMLSAIEGSQKVFIHTSGSSIVSDVAKGAGSERVFDESTQINPLPGRTNRVSINKMVIESASRGIHSIVIAPTLIYGDGMGVNKHSIQIPWLIKLAKKKKCAHHIGPGQNIWSNVHIEDVIDLYLLALKHAPSGSFYFAENGECSMRQVCVLINKALNYNVAPLSMSIEEASTEWGEVSANYTMGSNSRVSSNLAREQLGWAPFRPSLEKFLKSGLI